jgi:signal transduction histidine kinase
MRTGYPLIIAMVLVVTSFAVSLGYSQYLVQQIDEGALAIIQEAIPRFEHIAEARRALLQLATLTDEYIANGVEQPEPDEQAERAQLYALMEQMRVELGAYHAGSPQEAAEISSIKQDVEQLETATRRAVGSINAGNRAAALAEFVAHTRPLELQISRTFERLRRLNEERVRSDTEHIRTVRHDAVQAATALGLLSLALSIAATALVLQGQQARTRLMEERDRLLTERADELESFAGRVAHDLRDPLNAAGLRLAVLRRSGELGVQLRVHLDSAIQQLARMKGVIDGLLEFARSGAQPEAGAHADLNAVLLEVLTSVRPAAEAAHAELRIGPITEVSLAVAPEALSSVLSNLLGNAVKYVGEGEQLPHRIGVRASERAGLARIEVEDNGPGLPEGAEQRVFEPFRRLASKQPGTGLGLATVKRIVEAYQGRVGVVAEPGRGSTFWVEIPCSNMALGSPSEPAREA